MEGRAACGKFRYLWNLGLYYGTWAGIIELGDTVPVYYSRMMKKIISIIAVLAILAGCARQRVDVREDVPEEEIPVVDIPSIQVPIDGIDDEVARILARLTLRQKIGQTISLAIHGHEGQAIDAFLREYQPGMIFYLGNIVNSIEDMRQRNNRIRSLFRSAGLPLDPIIALDQEGGIVARLTRNVAHFPSAMAMAATGDTDLVFRAGKALGRQVRRAGCTMLYAPVLDLNLNAENPVIGTRAFSDKPELVLRYGRAFARGVKEAGVLPVAKHFPGHGRTSVDSHLALPIVTASREDLLKSDFSIFRGLDESTFPAVMTAHVVYSAIDSMPATLSRKIVHDWFQREGGYKGLIITDAVEMKALSSRWPYPEIYRRALLAGCHVVLTGMEYRETRAMILECERMVAQGRLDVQLIDAAAAKVIAFKLRHAKYLRAPSEGFDAAQLARDRAEDETLARTIAERAITLVQDPQGIFPMKAGTPIHLLSTNPRFLEHVRRLASGTGNRHPLGTSEVVLGDRAATSGFIQQMRQQLSTSQGVLVYAGERARDTRFLESLPEDLRQRVVIVALGDPWFARRLLQRNAYLATYSAGNLSLEACARALLGLIPIRGQSPVTIAPAHR
jgi:beta-N-acetylhexosaminidase